MKEMREESLDGVMKGVWFHEEAKEVIQWESFRKEALPLEKEHLELRVLLRDAEEALRADPGNENLKARVEYLKKRLEELDRKAPWISSDIAIEELLWGGVFGC